MSKIGNRVGVGIIGCGNISTAYLELSPLFKSLEVRAVADISPAAAEAQAKKFGVRAEGVADLIKAGDIDVVVNLTVPNAHFEVSRRVLDGGKHVYSEKPFVLALAEGEALRELATKKGLRVGSAPDTFLGGAHQLARATIDNEKIGKVIGGTAHVMSHGMEAWHPNPDFFFQPGGGPVLDLGPYYVTNLVQLLGPVRAVTAMTSASFATRTIGNGPRKGEEIPVDTPTNIHAILEFASGALVTLAASWDVWAHRHPNMELYGETGSLYVPDPNFFGGDVTLVAAGRDPVPLGWDHPFGRLNHEDNGGNLRANYRTAGLADMAAAIEEGRAHRAGLDLALHVVDVLTSILKSGEKRGWIELTTSCERPAALSPEAAAALLA